MSGVLPLLAETTRASDLEWATLPPAWITGMLIVPTALLFGWWAYRRETDVPNRARWFLGGLRALALLFVALVLAGPYTTLTKTRTVQSHLIVMVDTSASMSTVDGYDPKDAEALAGAFGGEVAELSRMNRLQLARRVLAHPDGKLLPGLIEKFQLHVFTFGSQLTPVVSIDETERGEDTTVANPMQLVRDRLEALEADQPSTRLAQAVARALDTFRLRDEPVAGIVVISDGQQNGGTLTTLQAGRRAESQKVPIFAVGVGDPRSPMNIHVSNLRAKEVVLARDTAVFEFTVRARGFANRVVRVELQELDDEGEPTGATLAISPDTVKLEGGKKEQKVRVTHRFLRAGTFSLRIGVPVQSEEKIKSDNHVLHTLRVIDRKIKVLYVEAYPRHEFYYLSQALTRDVETLRVHCLLLNADPNSPQPATRVPDWSPLDLRDGIPSREALFDYDVLVLGDVDWTLLASTKEQALDVLQNVREFVDKGGGLIMISGPRDNPSRYKDTPVAPLLPIVVDRAVEHTAPRGDTVNGIHWKITPEGEQSPIMNLTGDPERSKMLWETEAEWRQRSSYPALRAKTLARVLAVAGDRTLDNKYGPRPLIATMLYGRGRTLYLGVDELWLMRKDVADQYFYRFYGEAIRFLATYKLKGGNKRFKIITDRNTYPVDASVRITVDVLDRDYNPAREESQTLTLELPGNRPGTRETVELIIPAAPNEPGTYRRTMLPTRPGDYRLSAETDDADDERPEKLFHVVHSTLEGRNLLLDEARLRELADSSGEGRYLRLWDLQDLEVAPLDREVNVGSETEELWDNWWTLMIAVSLLGAEWMLRKRWHMV